jgi:hypothetical protein
MTTITETDFTIKQGSDWSRTLILKDDTGTVINLTGYEAKMEIRKEKSKTSLLYDGLYSTGASPRIVITPLEGKLVFTVPSTVSDYYRFTTGYYDFEIYIGSVVNRILQGTITIDRNVTD